MPDQPDDGLKQFEDYVQHQQEQAREAERVPGHDDRAAWAEHVDAHPEQDAPAAGDESYRGFRITEMWAVTAVDPGDDQEGVCAVYGQDGVMPLVASDRIRAKDLMEHFLPVLRQDNPTATVKRFSLVESDGMPADTAQGILTDPEFKAYAARVNAELIPKIESSAFSVSLVPRGETDIKFAIELGLCIMMDKPILAMVPKGVVVPERLRRVADKIVEWDSDGDHEAHAAVGQEIATFIREQGLDGP